MEATAATLERRVRVIPATRKPEELHRDHDGKMRVAAYCRVSTDSEEQLNSYEAQKTYYTQKIQDSPDWEMAGIYADEGISGTSLKKRTQFNKMITACKRGHIDLIITKSLSRFARNTVDCLDTVRLLKANGIGVYFEKENINTLTESSEFLITLFSGFAQAESESLSKNVAWGKQKSAEAGKVAFQYKKMPGYRKGADGQPEIVLEEAEIIRRIYHRYLDGCTMGQIKRELEEDGVPTAQGVERWSPSIIHNILTNEKYIGDALLQKTYVTDCITKKVKKNRGERTMYYVENSHPAIVSRDLFNQVQQEITRRSSKRKVLQKSGKTELGKYSGKYALTELLWAESWFLGIFQQQIFSHKSPTLLWVWLEGVRMAPISRRGHTMAHRANQGLNQRLFLLSMTTGSSLSTASQILIWGFVISQSSFPCQ